MSSVAVIGAIFIVLPTKRPVNCTLMTVKAPGSPGLRVRRRWSTLVSDLGYLKLVPMSEDYGPQIMAFVDRQREPTSVDIHAV
jgi:hypothetical protein